MKTKLSRSPSWKQFRQGLVAIGCAVSVLPGERWLFAQTPIATPTPAPAVPAELEEAKIPPEQLDSLVAPIALYPDPLLAQTLVASTYPLEIIQLHQWLAKNKTLKDKALADAVAKQPWDPAVQSMAAVPDVVKRLSDDIQWTTELGNAFLAQQSDVMDAVQRMRKKAQDNGALKTNEQQKVETKVIEEKTVIIVEQANPEYIYVPSYSPTVVYGPPYYPYPPIYYPPYPPGAAFVSFSVGVMFGAAVWGGGWGCGWGHNDVNINIDRNFNNVNVGGGGRGNNNWSHNPEHRGAAPYSNKATADKFGGSSRGQAGAGNRAAPSASASNRSTGASRGGSAGASTMDRGGGSGASRSASPSASSRSTGSSGSQIGSRDMGSSSSSRSSGFSGGSSGFSGSSARASSSRGASSFGGSRGGGGGRRR